MKDTDYLKEYFDKAAVFPAAADFAAKIKEEFAEKSQILINRKQFLMVD